MTKEFRCPYLDPDGITCRGVFTVTQVNEGTDQIERKFIFPTLIQNIKIKPFAEPPSASGQCGVPKRPDLQALCSPNQTDKTS